MPTGLAVMQWRDRSGTKLLAKYPDELNLSDALLMQVYNIHEYTSEAGTTSCKNELNNIISYYSGRSNSYYIILMLTESEDPDDFDVEIKKVSKIILKNLKHDVYKLMLPSLLERLSK